MHIFISYAKVDSYELARRIHDAIIAIPGITAWMDDSLETASSWAAQIQIEIDRCDYVVLLLSPDVNRTPSATQARSFVLNEIDYALEGHKSIIPVMAQRTRIPVQIAGIQYIDFTRNQDTGLQRLLNDIGKLAGIAVVQPTTVSPPARPMTRRLTRILSIPVVVLIAIVLLLVFNSNLILPPPHPTDTPKEFPNPTIDRQNPQSLPSDPTEAALASTEGARVSISPTLNDDQIILTRAAMILATETAKAPTATPTPTATSTVDQAATKHAHDLETRAMLMVTSILETQAAQAAADLPTNTPMPTDTATFVPTSTMTLTLMPTPLPTSAVGATMTQSVQQTIVFSAAVATVTAQANDQDRIRRAAFNITTAFEGGSYASYQTYDSGIISYGRFFFTLAAGSLTTVVNRYIDQSNSATAAELRNYLPQLNAKDESLRKDDNLKNLLIAAASDPVMQAIQDQIATENYWNDILALSINPRNIQTPLGQALIFDMAIQHGKYNFLLPKTEEELGIPTKSRLGENGVTEQQFITKLAELRHDNLSALGDKLNLPNMVKRGDFWLDLINTGDWNLQGDANGNVNINGKIIQVRNP